MYLLLLLFLNLHLGLGLYSSLGWQDPKFGRDRPVRPEDLTQSRYPYSYYPTDNYTAGILDFSWAWLGPLEYWHQNVNSTTSIEDDVFKITLFVPKQIKPEEVTVKVVNRWVVVEGKHEATKDDGNDLTWQFLRQYLLPIRAEVEPIKATLSSDGILIVKAPHRVMKPLDERVIKIEQTGKPAVLPNSRKEAGV